MSTIEDPYDFQHEDRAKKAEPFVMWALLEQEK